MRDRQAFEVLTQVLQGASGLQFSRQGSMHAPCTYRDRSVPIWCCKTPRGVPADAQDLEVLAHVTVSGCSPREHSGGGINQAV